MFEDAWASSSWTLPTLASLLTGTPASTHGCWNFRTRLDRDAHTLVESVTAAGWDTAAVVNHSFLGRRYGLDQGFVHYDDELVETLHESHRAVTSPIVSDKGLAFLGAKAAADDGRPWLLWLHYFDPHMVYQAHEDFVDTFGDSDDHDRYRGEIAFTDRHVGRVLDGLEELGLADDTVVVLVADHGEEWQDHLQQGHGKTLYREVVRVPLIVRVPAAEPRRVATRVSGVDLAPTLLELLGLEPLPVGTGRSLVPALRGRALEARPALAELRLNDWNHLGAYGRGRWKLVWSESRQQAELYDVVADPGEQEDRAAEEPALVAELLAEYRAACTAAEMLTGPHAASAELDLSEHEQRALEALGYVEDEAYAAGRGEAEEGDE